MNALRNAPANASRVPDGSAMHTSAAMRQAAPTATSTLASWRVARGTAVCGARGRKRSGRQDRPVLLFIIEDAAGPAHDAGQRILVHVNRQSRLLREQDVEPANQRDRKS